ncbi:hypothetical protein MUY27_06240 [Mucilaginibacter sp. RS28]|uniref:Uncharacterized protein n=1 Tax=Mucilaginibacter straminoryzae TaxID=2932774 RepID=A0A9X1X2T4_9SPHI|nr:hypothetical protein [Mucilaginibacter straminoryzae]MCJ8209300.1 hypothetical protein [Mucilaginibacter straminoryzae]
MFENLFMLVKSNAGEAVIQNPVIPAGQSEAVINDASSAIIEVLKKQLDNGRIKDLIRFFKFMDVKNNELVTSMINRFANKLNKYYNIDPKSAFNASSLLIVPVIEQMAKLSKSTAESEFTINRFLSKLSGGNDFSTLVDSYMAA